MAVYRKTRSEENALESILAALKECEGEIVRRARKPGYLTWLIAKKAFRVKLVVANGDDGGPSVEKEIAWCEVFLDRRKSKRTYKQLEPAER